MIIKLTNSTAIIEATENACQLQYHENDGPNRSPEICKTCKIIDQIAHLEFVVHHYQVLQIQRSPPPPPVILLLLQSAENLQQCSKTFIRYFLNMLN